MRAAPPASTNQPHQGQGESLRDLGLPSDFEVKEEEGKREEEEEGEGEEMDREIEEGGGEEGVCDESAEEEELREGKEGSRIETELAALGTKLHREIGYAAEGDRPEFHTNGEKEEKALNPVHC